MSQDTPDLPDHVAESALDVVRANVVQLLSDFPRPPSMLRIHAGGVTLEAEWPVGSAPSSTGVSPALATSAGAAPAPLDHTTDGPHLEKDSVHYLRAPAVGVFFQAPEPGAKPFVDVGDTVAAGRQVAIVEVMKLMIPVQADTEGRIVKVLKANGETVEYDEPLFALTPLER